METSENSVRVFCLNFEIVGFVSNYIITIFLHSIRSLSELALGAVHHSLAEAVSRRQNVL